MKYTPDELGIKFDEYVEWAKNNPRQAYKVTKDGPMLVDIGRPLTLVSFCAYAGISKATFTNYERLDEFRPQCARVRETIESDQIEGAILGQYAQNIVARVLQLADKSELVSKTERERVSEMSDEELQAEIDKELNNERKRAAEDADDRAKEEGRA